LTINVAAAAPVISSVPGATGAVGTAFSYQITATNSPTSYILSGSLPSGLSFNASTGTINGTPTANGVSVVTISATNAGGTGTANLTIAVGIPLTILSGSPSLGLGQTLTLTSTTSASGNNLVNQAVDYSTDNQNWTSGWNNWSGQTCWSGGPTGSNAVTISWTPTAAGTYYFRARGQDSAGNLSAFSYVTTTVTSAQVVLSSYNFSSNSPPTISTAQPLQSMYRLRAKFVDGSAYGFQAATSFNNNKFSLDALPVPASYPATYLVGLYWIQYDPTGNTILQIGPENDVQVTISQNATVAPQITSTLTATATQNQAFSYQITANNSPTSFGASGLPPGLSLNASTGAISGTPTTTGSYSVQITATNSIGSGTATLAITVSGGTPQAVSVSPSSSTVAVGQTVTLSASGGAGTGNFVWSGSASGTGPMITVSFTSTGTYTMSVYRAADANDAQSAPATATIYVTATTPATGNQTQLKLLVPTP
jgi:hypothetical protein